MTYSAALKRSFLSHNNRNSFNDEIACNAQNAWFVWILLLSVRILLQLLLYKLLDYYYYYYCTFIYVCYPMFIFKCVRRDSNLVNSIVQCCFHMLPNDLPQMFIFLFDRHGCHFTCRKQSKQQRLYDVSGAHDNPGVLLCNGENHKADTATWVIYSSGLIQKLKDLKRTIAWGSWNVK